MPAAIPLIVAAATYGTEYYVAATLFATVAVGVYEQDRAKAKARDSYNKSLQDRIFPIRSGIATRTYVVGTVRTSGPLMYAEVVGDHKEGFDVIIAAANNETQLEGWYLNEDFIDAAHFPGIKYGIAFARVDPAADDFTVTGPSATVQLSRTPKTTVNPIKVVWRQGATTGTATGSLGVGLNYNITGLPAGTVDVVVSYDAAATDKLRVQYQTGSESQASTTWGTEPASPKWTTDHRLRGVSHARVLFVWDDTLYQQGAPAVGVVVTGRGTSSHRYYDPRTNTNPSVTKNPALIAGWWMTMPRNLGGCGIPSDWIDWQSIAAAANVCDELVTVKKVDGSGYESIARYECNAVLDTGDSPLANLQDILSSMAGRRCFTAGLYKIVAGAFRPATMTLTDAHIAFDRSFTGSNASGNDVPPNIVTADFSDATKNWQATTPPPVKNDSYISADGHEEPTTISLPATTDPRRANYLMGVALEGMRPALRFEFFVNGVGEDFAVYDTLQLAITNRTQYAGKTFEIVELEDMWDGTFRVAVAEIKATTFALDPDKWTPLTPTPPTDISYLWNPPIINGFTVAAVTPQTLPDGTSVTRIDLQWEALADEGNTPAAKVELRYRLAGGDWISIASLPGDATRTFVTAALIDGEVYQFQARYINGVGAASQWVDAFTQIIGTPLPAPLTMRLRASSAIFRVPQTGNAVPLSIDLDVVRTTGLTQPATFVTNPVGLTLGGSGDHRTFAFSALGANASATITCTVTQSGIDYVDLVTILKVFDGNDANTTPDPTPPTTPSGVIITSFLVDLLVAWDPPVYTQGHGHAQTIIYAASVPSVGAQPQFINAVPVGSSASSAFKYPAAPGTRWALWLRHQSRDGYLGPVAGGTNGFQATTSQLGSTNLGDLIVTAQQIADGAVGNTKISLGAVDATKFASTIQPVSIVSSVPSTLSTRTVFNTTDGKLYRWNGTAYVATTPAADVTGQLSDTQLAAIAAAKITGQITATQITDGAITTPKLAAGSVTAAAIAADTITAAQIAAGAITASELAANSVTAGAIAAGSIVAGKIAAGAVSATEIAAGAITANKIAIRGEGSALNPDPYGVDATAWTNYPSGPLVGVTFNVPSSSAPNNTVMQLSGGSVSALSLQFPLVAGKRYRLSCLARKVSGSGGFYFQALCYVAGASGSGYTANILAANNVTVPGSFTRYSLVFDTPPNAVYASICAQANWSGSGLTEVTDMRCEEVIPGELIVDGAITARKLLIAGGGGALNDDPATSDLSAWNTQAAGTFTIANITDTQGVTTVARSNPSGSTGSPFSRPFSFNPSKTYRVRSRVRRTSDANGIFYLVVDLRDSSNQVINGDGTYWFYPASGATPGTSFTDYSAKFGFGTARPFPSNARTMAVGALLNYAGTSGYMEATDLLIEEAVDGSLIVDGAIQATHLSAGSIAVGTAAIANGAISNAMIGNASIDSAKIIELTVSKLTAGSLGADISVGAGKITFDNGVIMRVMGVGFGTANQFIEWFGLRPAGGNIALCSELNATQFLKTNGDAYFGGALLSGVLRNSAQTTDVTATASITIGPFNTNGHTKTINLGYTYFASKNVSSHPATGTFPVTASIQLFQKIGSGSETLVQTLTVNGTREVTQEDINLWHDEMSMSGGLTYTDNVGGTQQRTYRATISARDPAASQYTAGQTIQIISLGSTESST